jgi:hypothetical protein
MQPLRGALIGWLSANVLGVSSALLVAGSALLWCAPARAETSKRPAIWYRSSEGCPDGLAFLEMLQHRATPAQLAQVGDRIDFVVTLGSTPTGNSGRLERQTDRGTVALRELQGTTCAAIADALALTLVLTLDPMSDQNADAAAANAVAVSSGDASVSGSSTKPEAPAAASSKLALSTPASSERRSPAPWRPRSVRLGAVASVWTLSQQFPFLGGALFGELRDGRAGYGFRPSVRLSAAAGFSPDGGQSIGLSIWAGQLEGCPVVIGGGRLQLRPCTALELGVIRAVSDSPSGTSALGFWAAWAAHARLSWEAASDWGLDLQAGLIVPLTRYELTVEAPERTVAKTSSLGLAAGLGAHWALP